MSQPIINDLAVVAVYPSHTLAEQAIQDLSKAGYDLTKLSIIGKDYSTEEHVVGFYNTAERVATWGKNGAFWGGMFGLLFGTGLFFIPGMGPVFVAGPVLSWIVAGLEGALVVGGLSALGAALYSMGIPKDKVLEYESDIRTGRFVLVAHGDRQDVLTAKNILDVNASQYEISKQAVVEQVVAEHTMISSRI